MLRRNLQALPAIRTDERAAEPNRTASQNLIGRYLTKLGELEIELETYRTRLAGLRPRRTRRRELEKYLQTLVAE